MNHPWRTVLAVRISRVERTRKSFPCHASEQLTIPDGILPHGRGVSRFSLCAPRGLRSPPKLGNQRVSGNEAVTGSEDRKLGTFHEFFDPAGPLSVGRRLTNFPGKRQLQADPLRGVPERKWDVWGELPAQRAPARGHDRLFHPGRRGAARGGTGRRTPPHHLLADVINLTNAGFVGARVNVQRVG